MNAHESRLVKFLSRPDTYPHPVGLVDRRQTHVSHVFLAGDYAYKLKKPVKFPFLDASRLADRKRFCLLELSLNRRLAPSIYLGIVPVTEQAGRLALNGRGRPVEWLVKMRRLPEDRMLDQVLAASKATKRDIERLADRLLPFFRTAARGPAIRRYGEPTAVAELVLGNLRECAPFLGKLLEEPDRAFIEAAYKQFLALQGPVLARRAREGRIIDGHGDLRCENICLSSGGQTSLGSDPQVYDCVEFQPAFRCGDEVNDLSFLLMDLEFRGRHDLAKVLERRYRSAMHDPTFDDVLAFYKCHRSLVRGKVRGFAWLQHPRTTEGRRIQELSRRHYKLARGYAAAFAPPRLVVVGGMIGSGKSTLARGLAETLGAAWVRTDEIRVKEFARFRRPRQGFSGGLYAARVSAMVYARLEVRAATLLRQGRTVVCDGMFAKEQGRRRLQQLAKRLGASFHYIECWVPQTVALRRIGRRLAAGADLSEARPEHYARLRQGYERPRGWARRAHTRLSDDRRPEATLTAAVAALRQAWTG